MGIRRFNPVKRVKIDLGKICPDHVSVEEKKHCCHFKPKFVSDPYLKTRTTPQTSALGFSLGNLESIRTGENCYWSRNGLISGLISALNSGSGGLSSNPGWGHYVAFLGKTFHSQSASLHTGG